MKILIVDDDPIYRTLLTGILNKIGYETAEAVNGSDALNTMQKPDSPKLAIIDWVMPVMNGLDVLRHVRAINKNQPDSSPDLLRLDKDAGKSRNILNSKYVISEKPYLIMLSSKAEKADIIAALDAGADDYLTKPFNVEELKARLNVGQRMLEIQSAFAAQVAELKNAFNQIKTLRGIVPICASCKKIRNDTGYWQQVESYISHYTDAKFSHGVCPDCMKKLYPEYCDED